MLSLPEPILFCLAIVLQVAGVASLIVARVSERRGSPFPYQCLFILCLLAVGLATMFAIHAQNNWWVSCAGTLGVMSVGAIVDTGTRRQVVDF